MDKKIIVDLGDGMNEAEAFDTANNLVMRIDFFGEEVWRVRKKPQVKVAPENSNGPGQ